MNATHTRPASGATPPPTADLFSVVVSDDVLNGPWVDEDGCVIPASSARATPPPHPPQPPASPSLHTAARRRRLRLTWANAVEPEPVRWLWQDRIPVGELTLLAGREGIGKSLVAYTLIAAITRGKLDGIYRGVPRSALIVASEDSMRHTIVPRLLAAGADLQRVARVDVDTATVGETEVSLPDDVNALRDAIRAHDVALVLFDPLISRLGKLDTHRDAEVRQALEPIKRMAEEANVGTLCVIHVNKSKSSDILNAIMGSRAFTAVPRSVLFVAEDSDDRTVRLLGHAKNNLGAKADALSFTVQSVPVCEDPRINTGKLEWLGTSPRSIEEVVEDAASSDEQLTKLDDAIAWLETTLRQRGGAASPRDIKRDAQNAGHTARTVERAARRLRLCKDGAGPSTRWRLPSEDA